MATFLHTADWQLGLKLGYLPGDAGALQRAVRFETLKRIVALANDRRVDFVLVAGDAFDDNGVSDKCVRQTFDALKPLSPTPIYFLPGNHDALTPDSVYLRETFQREQPAHIHVLQTIEPVEPARGVVLLPCPLMHRHEVNDPTAHLQADDASRIRIAVAHGAMDVLPEGAECANRIDPRCVERARLDYLALGDWHGAWNLGERIWYSGTHEQTRFSENNTGNVLIVRIASPGSVPEVERIRVARTSWVQQESSLHTEGDIEALRVWYEGLADPEHTLVELRLRGTLSLPERERLDALLRQKADSLRWQRVIEDHLTATARDEDLDAIATGGFIRAAIDRLRAEAREGGTEAGALAGRALQLLYRLSREAGRGVP